MVDFHVGISLPFSVEYILCPFSLSFLSHNPIGTWVSTPIEFLFLFLVANLSLG